MRIDMNRILDEYHIDELTTNQVMDRYGFTHMQLAKWECAKCLHPRMDAYGTTFWPSEELDSVSNDPDAFETNLVCDTEASHMLDCYPSLLDQLEVALEPEYISGIRFWDQNVIKTLIDDHNIDK